MGISSAARNALGGGGDDIRRSAENIRGATSRTGADAARKSLSQSPQASKADDRSLGFSTARELVRTPRGREQLRALVREMSPQAQHNLQMQIAANTRSPSSPAKEISLTPEGNAMIELVFSDTFSPETQNWLKGVEQAGASPKQGLDSDQYGTGGQDLDQIDAVEDMTPKGPPDAPKVKGAKLRDPKSVPTFRSTEKTVANEDGSLSVKHSDVHMDRQTNAAVQKGKDYEKTLKAREDAIRKVLLKKYKTQEAIAAAPKEEIQALLEAADLPEVSARPGAVPDQYKGKPGGALPASTAPKENYTKMLHRVAETRDPHDPISHEGSIAGDWAAGVPSSVFAPRTNPGVQGPAIATTKISDHADLMSLARARGIKSPNQFATPEEFARAIVGGAHQEGFNITPVTPGQRADATGLVADLADSPEDIPPAAVGRTLRTYMPGEAKAASAAERALMQEQAIQSIARKAEQIFGHQGWGEDYKPTLRPAGTDGPSTETGMRAGMTRDVGQVPGDANQLGVADHPMPERKPISTEPPGTDIGEDVTPEDLVEMDARYSLDENAPAIPNSDSRFKVRSGRAEGDKAVVGRSKNREEGGNKPGEYQDEADLSRYNRENSSATPEELARRQSTYDQMQPNMQAEHNPARASELRRQIQQMIDDNPRPGPVVVETIRNLQRQLRSAVRLDETSGVKSMQGGGGGLIPHSSNPSNPNSPDYIPPVNGMGEPDGFGVDGYPQPDLGNPADLDEAGLRAAAGTDLSEGPTPRARVWYRNADGEWVESPIDLDGTPRDAGGPPQPPATPRNLNAPDEPLPPKGLDEPDAPGRRSWAQWAKRAAGGAALVGGGMGAYHMLQQASEPAPQPFGGNEGALPPPTNAIGGGVRPVRVSPEDRIRAVSQLLGNMRIDPRTQTPNNWIH